MGRRFKFMYYLCTISQNKCHVGCHYYCPSLCSFTTKEFQNNIQPCPTLPCVRRYVFLSVPTILLRFLLKLKFLKRYSKNPNMSNFMKIIQVGAELFSTDRKTDRQTDIQTYRQKLIVALRDIAKARKERQYYRRLGKTHRLQEM
jgi:hypothetical protein